MRVFIISLLFFSNFLAMDLDEIISISLSKSPSLESINARIKANEKSVEISNQFSNPELLLTTNTLDSSEPMSQTVLTLKQKLPFYSKRDTKESLWLAKEEVLKAKLIEAEVTLARKIKDEAYTIWELRELKKIIDEYVHLTEQNIDLFESSVSSSSDQHIGIMKAKLSLSNLKIQESALDSKIYAAFARLSYLAAFEITKLDIKLRIDSKPKLIELQKTLLNNPSLLTKEKELLQEDAKVELSSISNYPDLNLVAGYSHREKFDSYFNLGFGLTLPMYGVEDAKEERAKVSRLAVSAQNEDIKISIDSVLKVYYAQMLSSYEIYHIIQDDSLPQIKHMFEVSNSSISTGSDLFQYIDVLFLKLNLERTSVKSITNYNRANAHISALAGEIK